VNQPLKWHGGKHYPTQQIVARMPPHTHYVEPYSGGLAVMLAKPYEGVSEVVNDLNAGLTNFWRVLQDAALFRQFRRRVEVVPFSEAEWQDAAALLDKMSRSSRPDVERAVRFFVRCRQSLAGRCQTFATTPPFVWSWACPMPFATWAIPRRVRWPDRPSRAMASTGWWGTMPRGAGDPMGRLCVRRPGREAASSPMVLVGRRDGQHV
jgi:hypothetical protein